jgi:tryptophan-rich sensory protein
MGVSAGLIWNTGAKDKAIKKALLAFSIHLILNGLWSILFFGLKNPELAFAEILLLLTSIMYYMALFYRIRPITAWMQIPYIAWVGFATLLNGSIAWLN